MVPVRRDRKIGWLEGQMFDDCRMLFQVHICRQYVVGITAKLMFHTARKVPDRIRYNQ